jgi:SAM-dependent methyltransferase
MVARARERGVDARVARAERLPFKPGWFDAVVARMAVHLLERPRAFAEAVRVLAPAGRLVIATEDPASFGEIWFARFFPSVPAIDAARFPTRELLNAELTQAGFATVQVEELRQQRTLARADALGVIRGQAYSTFALLDPDEYAAGLEQAERELPAELAYHFDWLLVAASR